MVVTYLKVLSQNVLEGLRRTKKYLSQGIWYKRRDTNPEPSEKENRGINHSNTTYGVEAENNNVFME
jgi:hypothetical protein